MTAPAMVLLANGSTEPSSEQVAHSLRRRMQELRPSLMVHLAFVEPGSPSPLEVIGALAAQGVKEAVFVPLDITHAAVAPELTSAAVAPARAVHPEVRSLVARPLGPACELLSILDLRVRQALSAGRVMELDALVLSAPNGGDLRGATLMSRRARQWRAHHKLPVQLAFADQAGHSITAAIATLHTQGRRLIAVGSFFLNHDQAYTEQAEAARAHGAVAVSDPIGADERLLDLAMARYSVAALDLLDTDAPPEDDDQCDEPGLGYSPEEDADDSHFAETADPARPRLRLVTSYD